MSIHVHPHDLRRPVLTPLRVAAARPDARAAAVDAATLSRRAAHYRALRGHDLRDRFHGATGQDPVADWAARSRPDLLILVDQGGSGVPVGLAEIHRSRLVAGVGELALSVLPQAQGRGIGRTLVDTALAAARDSGLQALDLCYDAGNRALARLMHGVGAEIDGYGPDRVARVRFRAETVSQSTDLAA